MITLVTGGAGFIGSHLCEALIKRQETVIAVDNFDPHYSRAIKEENLKYLSHFKNFHFHEIDIRRTERIVKKIFDRYQISSVFHLAGRGGIPKSTKYPMTYLANNVEGTLKLLEVVKERDIKIFVNASSSAVYGDRRVKFYSESLSTDRPKSVYAALKKSAEILCHAYYVNWHVPVVNVRLFSVYGPRGRPDQIISKLTRMIDDGQEIPWIEPEPQRDFTYVSDVVAGLVAILSLKNPSYHIVNLGDGKSESISRVVSEIERSIRKKASISLRSTTPPGSDISYTCADNRAARQLLGWSPRVSLREGIEKFVRWYLKSK